MAVNGTALVFFLLEVFGESVRPFEPRDQDVVKADDAGICDLMALLHGSPQLRCYIDGQILYFRAIIDVNLEWLLDIAANDKVVCVTLQKFRLRVWQ